MGTAPGFIPLIFIKLIAFRSEVYRKFDSQAD